MIAPRRIVNYVAGLFALAGCISAQNAYRLPEHGARVLPRGAGAPLSAGAAARFLEQASWGPTAAGVAHVQQVGFSAWLDEQFDSPLSPISDVEPNANGRLPMAPVQREFFSNAVNGADQLRQRVAFALSEIWVVSAVKLTTADQMLPYLRLLQRDAFATYPRIIRDVTLSPSMGHYLDMVNNDKPDPAAGKRADENYARELMQLFTIGLNELNDDGAPRLHNGQPIPTFDQAAVEAFARVFTGWTYPPKPGAAPRAHNPPYFEGEMTPVERNHDTGEKALLNGVILPSGRTAEADLNDALENIAGHHNVAPFVSRQLIQHLVTGNPSPAYVARVASAFRMSGGDMKTVIRAILLDDEARAGDDSAAAPGFGHLREPVLFINSLLRALNAQVTAGSGLPAQGSTLGQNVYYAPSVFNYFSPGYRFAAGAVSVNAPEFQLLSPATAMLRADFVNRLIYGAIGGVTLDWTPYLQLTPEDLVEAMNQALLRGAMPDAMRASVLKAVKAQSNARNRARAAAYLIASSAQYQVHR